MPVPVIFALKWFTLILNISELSYQNMRMQIIRSYAKEADQITDNVEKYTEP